MASVLSVTAAAAGTLATAAYLNARFHIYHDISSTGLSNKNTAIFQYLECQAKKRRLLAWHKFEEQVQKQPDHLFLIFEDKTWTYKEFFDGVTRVGNWLMKDLGVKEREVVALDGGNSPEHIMIWLALDGIGAVISFINNNLTSNAMLHCVKVCKAPYLLADRDIHSQIHPYETELRGLGVNTVYYSPDFISTLTDLTPLPESRRENVQATDDRLFIYTSGTTGNPKAVRIQTARELMIGRSIALYLRLKPSDRFYTCMPLYHGAAHGLCLGPIIHAGNTLVLGRKFSHRTFWPEVRKSRANIIQYVGELCRYLLNAPASELDKKHNVEMAWGNGMRPDVWEAFRERFGIETIHELYAATDGMGSSFNRNRGEFTKNAIGLRGKIWDLVNGRDEVRVKYDVDTGDIVKGKDGFAIECAVNEPGEVVHKVDPQMRDAAFQGYLGNQEATDKRFVENLFKKGDCWFRSGDMMRVDEHGRVYFVDRLGDTFRWKSENVSTNEVSDVLGNFHQIAEANVYGVRVPKADGRAGCAAIVMAKGVKLDEFDFAELARHALSHLPRYAVPIFLRITPQLEYTGTLKLQKGRLKEEGMNPDKVESSGDVLYWLPPNGQAYVPFGKGEFDSLHVGSVKL